MPDVYDAISEHNRVDFENARSARLRVTAGPQLSLRNETEALLPLHPDDVAIDRPPTATGSRARVQRGK
jgi:hypothetical protein